MHHARSCIVRAYGGMQETFYLRFHELRMALVDLHLLEFILPVVRVQQAAGL